MLIIEIGLTIWAGYRGHKWLAVLPLVIGVATGFCLGFIGSPIDGTWLDLGIIVILVMMIINGKSGKKKVG